MLIKTIAATFGCVHGEKHDIRWYHILFAVPINEDSIDISSPRRHELIGQIHDCWSKIPKPQRKHASLVQPYSTMNIYSLHTENKHRLFTLKMNWNEIMVNQSEFLCTIIYFVHPICLDMSIRLYVTYLKRDYENLFQWSNGIKIIEQEVMNMGHLYFGICHKCHFTRTRGGKRIHTHRIPQLPSKYWNYLRFTSKWQR